MVSPIMSSEALRQLCLNTLKSLKKIYSLVSLRLGIGPKL